MVSFSQILLRYVAPALGSILSTIMFAAPAKDLKDSMIRQDLGSLNPVPWAITSGNCLGWVVYGYLHQDLFVLFGNLPGLLISFWLNLGASTLQYHQLVSDDDNDVEEDGSISDSLHSLHQHHRRVFPPQSKIFLIIMLFWSMMLVWVGWFTPENPALVVGVTVNLNLILYYASPLQVIRTVVSEKDSSSIHVPTMVMNVLTTCFWLMYAIAIVDPVLGLPNFLGLLLALCQVFLCVTYPRSEGDEAKPLVGKNKNDSNV